MQHADKSMPKKSKTEPEPDRPPHLGTRAMAGLTYDEAVEARKPQPLPTETTVSQRGDGKWVSSVDPDMAFDARAQAVAYEQTLTLPRTMKTTKRDRDGELKTFGRQPTLYTYQHQGRRGGSDNPAATMSTLAIPQGPHSLAFAPVDKAMRGAEGTIDPRALAAEQVIPPAEWMRLVREQFAAKTEHADIFAGTSKDAERMKRAYHDYVALYFELQRHLGTPDVAGTKSDVEGVTKLVHRLHQLNPMASYGWWRTTKAPDKEIKGKGERATSVTDPKNFDPNGREQFADPEAYDVHMEDAALLEDKDADKAEGFDPDEEDVEVEEDPEAEPAFTPEASKGRSESAMLVDEAGRDLDMRAYLARRPDDEKAHPAPESRHRKKVEKFLGRKFAGIRKPSATREAKADDKTKQKRVGALKRGVDGGDDEHKKRKGS